MILHVQRENILLANVFENFRNTCFEVHELEPARFLTAPRLTWQAAFKKIIVKLDLLTDIDLLIMVEKGIRYCHTIHRCAKANEKYMKNYDTNEESSYLKYCEVNNLYVLAMSQKLPVKPYTDMNTELAKKAKKDFKQDFLKLMNNAVF